MKRTAKKVAGAFVLVAGLNGCMSTGSKPTASKTDQAATMAKMESGGVQQAGAAMPVGSKKDAAVMQAAALGVDGVSAKGGRMDPAVRPVGGFGGKGRPSYGPEAFGPSQTGIGTLLGHGGITPAPSMGPPGAVAVVPGALGGGPGGGMGGLYANGRTSIRFASPAGMKVTWMDGSRGFTDTGREAPVRYNFVQGNIYRLRLNGIAGRAGKNYYPTLEVYPPTTKEAMTFLSHSAVPVGFTDEDFDQVNAGNMVVKVIYLPSAQFQDVAAAEEIVSTRLEPGADPVAEASRRGTVLAVVRMGNIDLEDPTTPAMDAPPGGPVGPGPAVGGPKMPAPGPMGSGPMGSGPMGSGPMSAAPSAMPITPMPIPETKRADDAPKGLRVPASLPPVSLPAVK
jgi:hypothetical protein